MESNDITRRRVIGSLGAAGVAGLAGCGGGGGTPTATDGDGGDGGTTPTQTDTGGDGTDGDGGGGTPTATQTSTPQPVSGEVKIGMLQPVSGGVKPYGLEALHGFYSGFKYKGGSGASIPGPSKTTGTYEVQVGDVTYTIIVRDTQGSPSKAQSAAGQLVRSQNVDMLAGTTISASALSVANSVAKPAGVPFMAGPAATVALTAKKENCGKLVYRASENVGMDAFSGGKYIANNTDFDSVWIYYANYSFGQSVNKYYTKVLEENGITVAGSTPLPRGYAEDWPGQFQKAQNAGVDAIIGGFTVATLPDMVGTFVQNHKKYDFSFAGGFVTRVGSFLIGSTIAKIMGGISQGTLDKLQMGPFTTRYHWNQYENPINSKFIDIHTKKYGYFPDLFSSGLFTAASSIDQAVRTTGSTKASDIATGLKGMSVKDTPKGEGGYKFQEYNNQARSKMTVADPVPTTKEAGKFWQFQGNPVPFMPGEPKKTYQPDQTTLKPSDKEMTCSL